MTERRSYQDGYFEGLGLGLVIAGQEKRRIRIQKLSTPQILELIEDLKRELTRRHIARDQ